MSFSQRKSDFGGVSRKDAEERRRKATLEHCNLKYFFMSENEIATVVVDKAFKIHKLFGPGMFESVYETLLKYELRKVFGNVKRQCSIPLVHENLVVPEAFKADLIVEDKVLIELKSVEEMGKLPYKQVTTYLNLTGYHLGLLINFNTILIKDGIKRIVNDLEE